MARNQYLKGFCPTADGVYIFEPIMQSNPEKNQFGFAGEKLTSEDTIEIILTFGEAVQLLQRIKHLKGEETAFVEGVKQLQAQTPAS